MKLLLAPFRLLILVLGLMVLGQTANAACASPAGNVGDIRYASNYGVMVFCNDQNWVSMAGGVSVTVNTSGGGATPAGSTNDVQFNSSGALAADSGHFTYSSGLLTTPNISTGNVSATTINATGLGTMGSLLVAGGATVTGQASLTVISTSLIQVGNSGASCTSNLAGGVRYNSTSNTIDYCSGSAWLSLGPSATVVPSFYVTRGGNDQTVTSGAVTRVSFTTKVFDTNNNFDTTTSTFTPTVPGRYIVNASVWCRSTTTSCYTILMKNGTNIAQQNMLNANGEAAVNTIVDMNGTTDYLTLNAQSNGGTVFDGHTYTTFMTGALLTMNGAGGSGTANPAGSNNDVQFNSGGLLAADSGNFIYANSTLAAPYISATAISTTIANFVSASTYANVVGGLGNMISSGTSSVSASTTGVGIFAGGEQLMSASAAGTTFYSPLTIRSTSAVTGTMIAQFVAGTGRQLQINQPDPTDIGSPFTFMTPNSFEFMVDAIPAFFIDQAGNVAMNAITATVAPNPGFTFQSAIGRLNIGNTAGTTGQTFIGFYRSGTQIGAVAQNGTTAVAYNTTSDRRVKEDISDTREGLQKLMRIPVRDFAFKADPSHTIVTGFIAQELDKVFPEAVTTNGDDGETPLKDKAKPWSVDYGRVTPLIVKAVQDLKTEKDGEIGDLAAALKAANDNISKLAARLDADERLIEQLKKSAAK